MSKQIASLNLNIHEPREVSASVICEDADFTGVSLYVATGDDSEVTLHFYFRDEKHREHAIGLRDAINALGIAAPDPEPPMEVNYDLDPIPEQRMDASDFEEARPC